MDKLMTQIDQIISDINWSLVKSCIESTGIKCLDVKSEKEKLKKSLFFVGMTHADELISDYWIIKYNKSLEIIQVYFTLYYISSTLSINEAKNASIMNSENDEAAALHKMLVNEIEKENYLVCDLISKRLNEIKSKGSVCKQVLN